MSPSNKSYPGSAVWNGTLKEELDLMAAIQHNCECRFDGNDRCLTACPGHAMLAGDQRALNGLLWERHLLQRLLSEEGIGTP
jgi:hypothetical protein